MFFGKFLLSQQHRSYLISNASRLRSPWVTTSSSPRRGRWPSMCWSGSRRVSFRGSARRHTRGDKLSFCSEAPSRLPHRHRRGLTWRVAVIRPIGRRPRGPTLHEETLTPTQSQRREVKQSKHPDSSSHSSLLRMYSDIGYK